MIKNSPPQSPTQTTSPALKAQILSHRVHLSSKYAFLFCQDVVNGVKNNSFSIPPKRLIQTDDVDHKLELEASTSAGSGFTLESTQRSETTPLPLQPLAAVQRPQIISQALAKVVEYEEFLLTSKLVSEEAVQTASRLHRESLKILEGDGFAARDATETAFAVMAFVSERLEMDKNMLKKFAESMLGARRAKQLDKVRKVRAYTLLASLMTKGNPMSL